MAADSGGGAAPFTIKLCRKSVNFHREAGGRHNYQVLPGRDQTARRTDFRIAMETNALKPSTKNNGMLSFNCIPAGVGHGETRQLKSCLTLDNRGEPLFLR